MSLREKKKRQTRQLLMQSALSLIEQGDNFVRISLRDVAKTAGLVPTAFYRHFENMEDLGLNLVAELSRTLRALLKEARATHAQAGVKIDASIRVYMTQVRNEPALFRFMMQTRTGGSASLRQAIRQEMGFIAGELAKDLSDDPRMANLDPAIRERIASLIVHGVVESTIDWLDTDLQQPEICQHLIEDASQRVRLILLGGRAHHSKSEKG